MVLYKDMTDEQLKAAYADVRQLLANASNMAHPAMGRGSRAGVAGSVFRLTRDLDIVVAVARRRGLRLM